MRKMKEKKIFCTWNEKSISMFRVSSDTFVLLLSLFSSSSYNFLVKLRLKMFVRKLWLMDRTGSKSSHNLDLLCWRVIQCSYLKMSHINFRKLIILKSFEILKYFTISVSVKIIHQNLLKISHLKKNVKNLFTSKIFTKCHAFL